MDLEGREPARNVPGPTPGQPSPRLAERARQAVDRERVGAPKAAKLGRLRSVKASFLRAMVVAGALGEATSTFSGEVREILSPAQAAAQPPPSPLAEGSSVREVHNRRVNVHALTVAVEMETMLGHQATWTPSGPGSGNTFERWVSAPAEATAPTLDTRDTSINCWEMVLLAAFRSNMVSWNWLHDLYQADSPFTWGDSAIAKMVPSGTAVLDPLKPDSPEPQRGDLVFWNGLSHVGLALGTRDAAGRHEVISFWPPPNGSFGDPYDPVKTTTVEELCDYMRNNYMGNPTVTFGEPAW